MPSDRSSKSDKNPFYDVTPLGRRSPMICTCGGVGSENPARSILGLRKPILREHERASMDQITGRAMRAYFMMAARDGYREEQPSSASGEAEINGKRYVALRNARGIIAAYRVRPNGMLRRLRRWPSQLEDW
jgi:hypothetical protein